MPYVACECPGPHARLLAKQSLQPHVLRSGDHFKPILLLPQFILSGGVCGGVCGRVCVVGCVVGCTVVGSRVSHVLGKYCLLRYNPHAYVKHLMCHM